MTGWPIALRWTTAKMTHWLRDLKFTLYLKKKVISILTSPTCVVSLWHTAPTGTRVLEYSSSLFYIQHLQVLYDLQHLHIHKEREYNVMYSLSLTYSTYRHSISLLLSWQWHLIVVFNTDITLKSGPKSTRGTDYLCKVRWWRAFFRTCTCAARGCKRRRWATKSWVLEYLGTRGRRR